MHKHIEFSQVCNCVWSKRQGGWLYTCSGHNPNAVYAEPANSF